MPPLHPCGVCDKGCRDNCVECSGCVKWVHKRCVPGMDSSLLSEWEGWVGVHSILNLLSTRKELHGLKKQVHTRLPAMSIEVTPQRQHATAKHRTRMTNTSE